MSFSEIRKKTKLSKIWLIRNLNNMIIFTEQAIPILGAEQTKYNKKPPNKTNSFVFSIPGRVKEFTAIRTRGELIKIYSSFINRELFETFLIDAVSQVEAFFSSILRTVLTYYPHRLEEKNLKSDNRKTFTLDVLLDSDSKEDAIQKVIDHYINKLTYKSPKKFSDQFGRIVRIKMECKSLDEYFEIKATRDIIIHNSGKVNSKYIEKAGELARADENETIPIDKGYFENALSSLRRLVTTITNRITTKYSKTRVKKKPTKKKPTKKKPTKKKPTKKKPTKKRHAK